MLVLQHDTTTSVQEHPHQAGGGLTQNSRSRKKLLSQEDIHNQEIFYCRVPNAPMQHALSSWMDAQQGGASWGVVLYMKIIVCLSSSLSQRSSYLEKSSNLSWY
jgi:hypothetical protein